MPLGRKTAFTFKLDGALDGAMVIARVCVGETVPVLSFTLTPKVNGLPTDVVGVPAITPEALNVKPGGKEPVRAQLP